MCSTWRPRGRLLAPDTRPEADARMANFASLYGGGHTGYHELRHQATVLANDSGHARRPTAILGACRDLYALGY